MDAKHIFNELHHICIVVRNIDDAIEYYTSIGIGPWNQFPSLEVFKDNLDVPDPVSFFKMKYRYANLGNVQLQLCEPPEGNTPQRRFLDTKGEGVFHLGFTVPDCDKGEEQAKGLGLSPTMRGRMAKGSGFTYFDTADKGAGVTLEIRASIQT
ncbi:VOC family protein [Herbaspirillum sp. GCM10030257]|uniref:VOC family protein n=1 Tax=Herbaspirillum sp. GCM10030257 TaxID=3273393 RepID=UPI00361832B4